MKRNIIIVCSLVLAVLLIPIILICFAFCLPSQYDSSFYGGMSVKYNRLKSVDGNKIVIIGGSNVAFGVRSDIMERELGMPVVNFGLYANLGTKYMLDVAEDYIGDGDIVIVAPEQNEQALSLYFNGEAVWYSVDGNFKILEKISDSDYGSLAKNFLSFVSGKFGYWQKGEKPHPDGVYNADSFNIYGDIEYPRPYNIMSDGYDSGMPITFDENIISDEFIEYLNEYGSRLRDKGANVFYSFCPMNGAAVEQAENADYVFDYYARLSEKLNIDILGNPQKRIMDSEWFYDSNFHLNSSGAVYYSAQLCQDIKSAFGDYTAVDIAIPQKPQKPDDEGINSSVSEDLQKAAEIFQLSGVDISTSDGQVVFGGEWTITGLTEYGASLSELVIPDTLAGLPVKVLGEKCFDGNANITTVTFGANLGSIGNGAFDGCINLSRIYVTSTNPNSLHPYPEMFSETADCVFYVPQSAYTDYLFDYFWSYLGGDRILSY